MPIYIESAAIDDRLDALIDAQRVRVSRTAFAQAVLEQAVQAFEATGDPDAWIMPAPVPPAQGESSAAGSVRPATQANQESFPAVSKRPPRASAGTR